MTVYHVTRAQLLILYEKWGQKTATVPTKSLFTLLQWPVGLMDFDVIICRKTAHKSDRGRVLYSIEPTNDVMAAALLESSK